jgi:hypothetical protein
MAKKKSRKRTAKASSIPEMIVTARNKSGRDIKKGEVLMINGFGRSPDDERLELQAFNLGSGSLLPVFDVSPMRPIVAMTLRRRRLQKTEANQLPDGMFLVPDLVLPDEESRHFSFWNLAAMLSLAMQKFTRPSAGTIKSSLVDSFLPQFLNMTHVAVQQLDTFLGELGGRRDRARTRTRLDDLGQWAWGQSIERFGTSKKGPLKVPAGIATTSIRLAQTGTWVKNYGHEITLAKKAKLRLDDTDKDILRLMLRDGERLLTWQIVERLDRSKGSLSKNLARLVRLGLIHNLKRKGYLLTDEGERVATELKLKRKRSL